MLERGGFLAEKKIIDQEHEELNDRMSKRILVNFQNLIFVRVCRNQSGDKSIARGHIVNLKLNAVIYHSSNENPMKKLKQ
jgi:hypothetical protein